MGSLGELKGFRFKKELGQNFLFDGALLDFIALSGKEAGNPAVALEVGAGAGTLTARLCKHFDRVVAFEIDTDLRPVLIKALSGFNNVDVRFENVLKTNIETVDALIAEPYALVANLPYYITTPLIFHFLASRLLQSMTVMVQLEVAQRITAPCGADFGALSASVQSLAEAELLRVVKAQEFYPPPSVDSALLRLVKRDGAVYSKTAADFFKAVFAQKRKTLQNTLNSRYGIEKSVCAEYLESLGFKADARAEALGAEALRTLGERLNLI